MSGELKIFISSYHDQRRDKVIVWERTEAGKRIRCEFDPPYNFYVPDQAGTFEAITGETLKLLEFSNKHDFNEGCLAFRQRFESDLSPQEKVMMTYFEKGVPNLNVGFLDIEVDYNPNIGWSRPSNPYAPINAITLYLSEVQEYFTIAVPPPGWLKFARELYGETLLPTELSNKNFFFMENERELLEQFLQLISSVDILSGWNSEFFDLPYLGKRLELLFGESALRRLGFENAQAPYWGEKDRFKGSKEKELILNINSRVHLDYMALFKKFNLEGRQSHSLASISEEEIAVPKLHYDGSLYELYHGLWRPNLKALKPEAKWDDLYTAQVDRESIRLDLEQKELSDAQKAVISAHLEKADQLVKYKSFIKFITYNRVDVSCLVDLDQKFKYINLANNMVHEATVNFQSIFGSVQLIDTAIINYCHKKLNKIVFDKKHKQGQSVEGALVLSPKVGLHRMIGSVDINSLYPSTYRSLNLSPEKIVGQLVEREDGWRAVYLANLHPENEALQNVTVTIIPEGSSQSDADDGLEIIARNMIKFLRENKYALSAYGTILDQGSGEGLIPAILSYWFNGRKEMQGLKKKYAALADKRLAIINDKEDLEYLENLRLSEYYDMIQGVRKVLLNSTYGATLNEFSRFHDPRLGASTTGSGRQITTHMIEKIAQILMGEGAPKVIKTITHDDKTSDLINVYTIDVPPRIGPIYSDTDSCYFVMDTLVGDSVDDAIECADAIAVGVNESFQGFMQTVFFCHPGFDDKIKAAREIVATSGIFRAKKKYILLCADIEGKRISPDDKKALKSQGSDIKISSTPETIRELLKKVTMMILTNVDYKEITNYVINFRRNLNTNTTLNPLDFATVTSVNNLEEYFEKWNRIEKIGLGKVNLPNNVRSSINHNSCVKLFNSIDDRELTSGTKIKIIWLTNNDHGFESMAFNSDTEELPSWFTQNFQVDLKTTEKKLVDQKLKNILDPVGLEVPTEKTLIVNKLLSFD